MVEKYGKWPGVVAIVGDREMYCVPCAKLRYGSMAVQAVVDSLPGYQRYTDHEGNPLTVVLSGSEDLHGFHCGDECLARVMRGEITEVDTRLCDEGCSCYEVDWQAVDAEVERLTETCTSCLRLTTCLCFQCGRPLCAECEDRYGCRYCE